ncbi:helix-turn-helix transcriptional regulator [Maribacter sp. 2210JD10-5]|uniref:helix-turn-helix transcriptional regulator n=1 Tax=Maribacter sp. 2210JD10-5 TaxID=3386272 RepID=UPI0039BC2B34
MKKVEGSYFLDAAIGGGQSMLFIDFPGQMEFYHFRKSYFKIPVEMKSINPANSDWFLIHINLSKVGQQKKVDNQIIDFQKHLPIGLLLYGPDLEIDTLLPPNVEMELASIHFHRSFLDTYFDDWQKSIDTDKNLIYEDLDYRLENALYKALRSIDNKIECHANVLFFMNLFFEKIRAHSPTTRHKILHSEDVKNLLVASAHLRNPLSKKVPSLNELACIANMGVTKFKTSFKQLFGTPPIQYRNKIRMEFAREEIVAGRKTPTEISYDLGYSHPSNFTLAYKKYFNELPSSQT